MLPTLLCGRGRRSKYDDGIATSITRLQDFNARLPCPWNEDLLLAQSCQGEVGLPAKCVVDCRVYLFRGMCARKLSLLGNE
jgi:hypothetical protein